MLVKGKNLRLPGDARNSEFPQKTCGNDPAAGIRKTPWEPGAPA